MYYSCRVQHCAAYYCNKQFHYGTILASDSQLQILRYASIYPNHWNIWLINMIVWSANVRKKKGNSMEDKHVQYFLWTKCRIEGIRYNNFILMAKCHGNKKCAQHFGRKISNKETNACNRHVLLTNFQGSSESNRKLFSEKLRRKMTMCKTLPWEDFDGI